MTETNKLLVSPEKKKVKVGETDDKDRAANNKKTWKNQSNTNHLTRSNRPILIKENLGKLRLEADLVDAYSVPLIPSEGHEQYVIRNLQ